MAQPICFCDYEDDAEYCACKMPVAIQGEVCSMCTSGHHRLMRFYLRDDE